MSRHGMTITLLTSVAAVALATSALADPPGRVGRVATIDGGVSFLPPGADDWSWASRNYPVTDGESFWTGDDGRMELQVGAVDIRADSQTEVDVPTLHYGEMRLALPQGSLDIRVWRAPEGGVVVSTPAGDVRFDQAGLYRVDVGAPTNDGSYPVVEVTTLEGKAGAPSPEGVEPIFDGEAAVLYAGYDPQIQDGQYAAIDDWGRELEARERPHYDDQNGGETLTGYDDLAAAGDFSQDPQYGQVWYPRDVPQDWAPYRYGHWSYVEPWGYTWIDDQSWGFAPFHYGRWAQIDNRWAWIPGQPTPRPVYAPALVAFVGGVSWNFGGGGGAVGWVPLGPQEVYRPNYRVSDTYLRNVNVSNVHNMTVINNLTVNNTTNVTINNYRNAGAATVVRAATFSGASPVQRAALPVSPTVLAQAPALAAADRPAPSREARTGAPVAIAGRPAPTTVAARPPERIAAVRAAVVAAPSAPNRPPVIAGARIAPPAPRPAAAAPVLVAPAQVRNPAAQRAAAAAAPRLPTPSPARTFQPAATASSRPAPSPSMTPTRPAPVTVDQASRDAADQARMAQAKAAQAQTAQAQAASAQAAQAEAARATEARDADARQAQAQAAQAREAAAAQGQARAAQAAQAQEAQARQAEMQAAQARAAQEAAARNAAQAQARAAGQAEAAERAQTQAREAQVRAAQVRAAPAAEPRAAPAQAQSKPAPTQDAADKRSKDNDPKAPHPSQGTSLPVKGGSKIN